MLCGAVDLPQCYAVFQGMTVAQVIHSMDCSADGQLMDSSGVGCFHVLAAVNNAAVNVLAYVFGGRRAQTP